MTQYNEQSFPGLPPPVIELTMEQQFKLRRLEDLLHKASKEDLIIVFMALQRQCFALSNTVSNLVKQWPTHPPITPEGPSNVGTSSETNN